jgi:aspartyl-tRNA(Asn)/glutamyl-tRNA(Gln) amidotransferase subunit C
MAGVSRDDLLQLARLARLHLEPAELDALSDEMAAVLEHFAALATIDTSDVPAMTHAVPMDLRLRDDEPQPSLAVEDALRSAPARDGDFFVVPAILPGGE